MGHKSLKRQHYSTVIDIFILCLVLSHLLHPTIALAIRRQGASAPSSFHSNYGTISRSKPVHINIGQEPSVQRSLATPSIYDIISGKVQTKRRPLGNLPGYIHSTTSKPGIPATSNAPIPFRWTFGNANNQSPLDWSIDKQSRPILDETGHVKTLPNNHTTNGTKPTLLVIWVFEWPPDDTKKTNSTSLKKLRDSAIKIPYDWEVKRNNVSQLNVSSNEGSGSNVDNRKHIMPQFQNVSNTARTHPKIIPFHLKFEKSMTTATPHTPVSFTTPGATASTSSTAIPFKWNWLWPNNAKSMMGAMATETATTSVMSTRKPTAASMMSTGATSTSKPRNKTAATTAKPKEEKKKKSRIITFGNRVIKATFSPKLIKPVAKDQLLSFLFGVRLLSFDFSPQILSPVWVRNLIGMTFNPELLHLSIAPRLLSPILRSQLIAGRFEPRFLSLRLLPEVLSPEINTQLIYTDVRAPRGLELLLRPRVLSPEIDLQLIRFRPFANLLSQLVQPGVLSPLIRLQLLRVQPAKLVLSKVLFGGILSPSIDGSLNDGLWVVHLFGVGGPGFGGAGPGAVRIPGLG